MSLSEPQKPSDPFREARQEEGVLECPFQGKSLPMILRHADVRQAARDWQTFSSDAPFRVPIPSEEEVRTVRQLPIETNPPEHTQYRQIVEPFFQRAKMPEVMARVKSLIDRMIHSALGQESIDAIGGFALPLQSRALTHLLNVPESEAEIWIGWGIHVFKATSGGFKQGSVLDDYLEAKFDAASGSGGDDLLDTTWALLREFIAAVYEGHGSSHSYQELYAAVEAAADAVDAVMGRHLELHAATLDPGAARLDRHGQARRRRRVMGEIDHGTQRPLALVQIGCQQFHASPFQQAGEVSGGEHRRHGLERGGLGIERRHGLRG